MNAREMVDALADEGGEDEEILTVDGFDEALIGLVEGWHPTGERFTVALYDRAACIAILMTRDDMDNESAVDFFEFNVSGAYHGPGTPMFAMLSEDFYEEGEEGEE